MTVSWDRDSVRQAARQLADHPQDQGWRELYRLFYGELDDEASPLSQILDEHFSSRPYGGAAHAFTLLGIALKQHAGGRFGDLTRPSNPDRHTVLNTILTSGVQQIGSIMRDRQNSFTSARRFLIPQLLFAGYFATTGAQARVLDVGTGLGVLPRQLNCQTAYDAFAPDLAWPQGAASYRPIPLQARFGVDRAPFPDLDWVRTCYGDSDYYRRIYDELLWAMDLPEVRDAPVDLHELDIQDLDQLAQFVSGHQINAVNCSYVLYELTDDAQDKVIAALLAAMATPGLLIVTEPRPQLAYHGCSVTLYRAGDPAPIDFAVVSDRHLIGNVELAGGYHEFVRRYLPDAPALALG
jgi:hypothetical protein